MQKKCASCGSPNLKRAGSHVFDCLDCGSRSFIREDVEEEPAFLNEVFKEQQEKQKPPRENTPFIRDENQASPEKKDLLWGTDAEKPGNLPISQKTRVYIWLLVIFFFPFSVPFVILWLIYTYAKKNKLQIKV